MPEPYTWVDWQVGKRGRWQRVRLAELPDPPAVDDKVTMQRFASPIPQEREPHKASFVLDFDAHAEWLPLEHCLKEVRCFLSAWEARWGVPSDLLHIAFSGRAGFHVTIPGLLLGDIASPELTTAYRRWASAIKDALGLITLDAPSRQAPEWWYPRIAQAVGHLPASVQDVDAFRLSLRRVGIYTRRRMIRRENSQHPRSGLFKIPLLPAELAQGVAAIRRLARQPRCLPARLAPPTHPGLAEELQHLLALITVQEEQRRAAHTDRTHAHDGQPDTPLPAQAGAPLCIQRILAQPAREGSSNMPLITVLSYWRVTGVSEGDAIARATTWLLYAVTDPAKQDERLHSARSVGHTVYSHRYRFAHHFVAPLRVVTDAECAACPIRSRCWGGDP
jgi:hypothetical protein